MRMRVAIGMAAVVLTAVAGAGFLTLRWISRSSPQRLLIEATDAIQQGDIAKAAGILRELERVPEADEYCGVIDAGLLVSGDHPEQALLRLGSIKPEGALRGPALLYGAEAFYKLKRLLDAERLLTTLLSEQPDNITALRWLSAVYYDLGAFEAARVALLRLGELAPDDYRPARLLGLMHLDFEEYAEAASDYQQALDRSPPRNVRDEIVVELGRCLIALRRYDEALETLRSGSRGAVALALEGRCLMNNGHSEDATAVLARAKQLEPLDRDVLLLESDLLAEKKDFSGSIECLRTVVRLHPEDLQCRYRLAIALQKSGGGAEAEEELQKWKSMNELTTRLSDLNKEAVAKPRDAAIRDELANVCTQLGRPELARMWKEAAAACRTAGDPSSNSFAPVETAIP